MNDKNYDNNQINPINKDDNICENENKKNENNKNANDIFDLLENDNDYIINNIKVGIKMKNLMNNNNI